MSLILKTARALAEKCALDGIGETCTTRLAKRRDVIDVDVETLARHVGRTSSPLPR